MQLLFVLVLLAGSTGLPVQDGALPHANNRLFQRSLPLERAIKFSTWRYVYVDQKGNSYDTQSNDLVTEVEVAASPKTSKRGLDAATRLIANMVKYMPSEIFSQLAEKGSAGVFTAAENLTVYPEFAQKANGKCGTSCAGACAKTCTADGRKYEELAGLGGRRAVVLEDNLLCTKKDPYDKVQNILVHELAHTIHRQALPLKVKQDITAAYQNAKSKGIWENTSYALSNEYEYFAEGATAYLKVNQNNESSGGMAYCDGKPCTSLEAARKHLLDKDPDLYKILNLVFTNGRSQLDSRVTVCP